LGFADTQHMHEQSFHLNSASTDSDFSGFGHDLIAAFHSHGNLGCCNTKYIGAEVEDGNL
jgi:hypothetical protein